MSLDIALSGIQAINDQLGTISNNIANAGTFGFKASRANFASQYSGDQASGTRIGSVTQTIGTVGSTLQTGRGLDAAINGRGFFVVKDGSNAPSFTRVGIFDSDNAGFLVDQSGRRVQGFAQLPGSTVLGPLGDLSLPSGQIPAVASTELSYLSNFSADWKAPDPAVNPFVPPDPVAVPATTPDPSSYNMSRVSVVYDSQGNQHSVTQYFVKAAAPNTVEVHFAIDGKGAPLAGIPMATLHFDANGKILDVNGGDPLLPKTLAVTFQPSVLDTTNGASDMNITIDYSGSTHSAGEATTSVNKADGYAAGNFSGVELAGDGSVVAKYTNGERMTVGKVAVATFASESQLTSISDTSWQANLDSGTPLYTTPGTGLAGSLTTSALEQSNVDVTTELVGLMVSQRNYQANSKVIQTESAVLQSLMQAM
ncbi:flagellar hook protein FlgE [Pseudoduganella namucuonensis]|uniref:Flagellar hook protein FlgE n=1 Tax=Pseudoduganella namucuonensis TaxID=1035707 RepID=A0A1I7HUC8_9BURK|nr:flagellar hook-basal body complex protein [Pseudoduganella namucuonensis]SFU64344.1 flagellar hook protein FlgE [Pseudoduganella namucuonensis]